MRKRGMQLKHFIRNAKAVESSGKIGVRSCGRLGVA